MTFIWILFGVLALISWTRMYNYDEPVFWIEQGVRALLGVGYGLLATQIFLAPVTFAWWVAWWIIPIIIARIPDIYLDYDEDNSVGLTINAGIAIILAVIGIIMITIYPAAMTKATYEYADSYTTVVETAVPETATEHIGLVSEITAHRLANPKIAEFGNSSKYTLGSYTKQSIDGNVIWVTPVEYASDFRASGSTPGYLIINAFDTSKDVEIVDGSKFYYMPSAIFGKDLKRHVYNSMPTKKLFDPMLQVDDEGTAFWVVPFGHYKNFWYLPVVDGVAIVNPTTGEIDSYKIDEVPAWVDAIIPGDVAEKYGKYYGENKNGWWARLFPTDQFTLTTWAGDDAWSIIYDENGNMWYTTDTTTMNTDKSMVGYMMINARTCEIKYFPNVSGLNGSGISENFVQLYKEKSGWTPVEPTLYNIYGTLTWFSTMVDENGAIQAYCLGDTKGNVVGETTMSAALISYKRMLATANLGTQDPTEDNSTQVIEGTVKRVIITGSTTKILLDTNQVFVVEESVSNMAQFTQPGDTVKISYLDTQEDVYYVTEFVNTTLE